MRNSAVVIFLGCATLAMLIETSVAETLCPYCVCLPSYSPVCGQIKETGKLRGFSSRCLLDCTNKCRKIKYEFVSNGRCGKLPKELTQATTTTTPSTTSGSTTAAPSTTMEAKTPASSVHVTTDDITGATSGSTLPQESTTV